MDERTKLKAIRTVLAGRGSRQEISPSLQGYASQFLHELDLRRFGFKIEKTFQREEVELYNIRCVVQTTISPLKRFYMELTFYIDAIPQFEFTTSAPSSMRPHEQAAQKQYVEDQYVVNFDPRMTPETFASRNSAKAKEILQRISLFYQRQ